MFDGVGVHLLFTALTVVFLFGMVILFGRLITFYQLPSEFHFENRPSLVVLYIKGLATALFRRQGAFAVRSPKEATDVDVLLNKALNKVSKTKKTAHPYGENNPKIVCLDCRIDPSNLAKYAEICGYPPDIPLNFVPPCFLETYFMPLLLCVVVSDDFKLSPLGLIHMRQTITQHTNINHLLREPFDLECGVAGYRFTTKGIEVDLSMKVYDRREMCIWQGMATLLSRDKSVRKGGGTQTNTQTSGDAGETTSAVKTLLLKVPGNCGLKYAECSGDYNPHHLWPWSAKLLGYNKPIAHGMWTLSRCVTWLKQIGKVTLDAPFHLEAQFKRPLFMPGSSVFKLLPSLEKDKQQFSVYDDKTNVPHLIGTINGNV